MSDSKLSALPVITTPTLADLLYIVQGGVSDAITVGNLIQRAPALTLVNPLTLPMPLAVNIGAVTAPTEFVVGSTSGLTPRGPMSWQSSNDALSAHYHMRKTRGTFAAPTTILTADVLGRVVYSGYDGASYLEMASIRVTAVGTVAATRIATKMEFFTGTDVAPSVATVALTLDQTQNATFTGTVTATALTLSTTPLSPASGGTGVANNAASTLTISGAFATTLTVTGVTSVTLPTSGTLLGTASTTATPQFARLGLGAAADAAIPLLITGGTVTVSTPVISATQTWNSGAVTFTGMLLNVTSTASAAASLLMDLQVASTSQWNVTKGGAVTQLGGLTLPSGSASVPSINFGDSTTGIYRANSGQFTMTFGSAARIRYASTIMSFDSGVQFGWSNTSSDPTATIDTSLFRDGVGMLAQRAGVTAQSFRIYNTFTTVATAGEWAGMNWTDTSNVFTITTKAGSTTGTTRPLTVGAGTSVGTDIAGAATTIQGGVSTGAGLGGSILFTLANKAGTGAGANTIGTVLTLAPPNSGTTALVNGLTITGAITTASPSISATGSDSNISIVLTPKGTGQIVFPAGLVGSPPITFGDLTTGFYRSSVNGMAFAVSGVATISINSSQFRMSAAELFGWASAADAVSNAIDTGLGRNAAGVLEVNSGVAGTRKQLYANSVRVDQVAVASLPAAATAGKGAHAFVTDANVTMTAGIGTTVVGGGANNVPVYSDGANWIIG